MKMNIKTVIAFALWIFTAFVIAGHTSDHTTVSVTQEQTVNINSADVKELTKVLDSIGTEKATAIIKYRKTHGKFTEATQLMKVEGIGKKLVEKNKAKITF